MTVARDRTRFLTLERTQADGRKLRLTGSGAGRVKIDADLATGRDVTAVVTKTPAI